MSALNCSNAYFATIFDAADKKLDEIRKYKPNAAGLITAYSQDEAREIQKKIPNSMLVISEESDSNDIEKFDKGDYKWLVSVQMVSEGVDIPRLRVLVFLHTTTTRLYFEQAMGRIVRNRQDLQGSHLDQAYFFYPNVAELNVHARAIEEEIAHIVGEQKIQVRQKYERKPPEGKPRFFENVIAGETTVYNYGQDVTPIQHMLQEYPIELQAGIERGVAKVMKSLPSHPKMEVPQVMDGNEYSDFLDEEIKKAVAEYQFLHNMTYEQRSDIHNKFNQLEGKYIRQQDMTIQQKERKLNALKSEIAYGKRRVQSNP
jgi:hypothetical protein